MVFDLDFWDDGRIEHKRVRDVRERAEANELQFSVQRVRYVD